MGNVNKTNVLLNKTSATTKTSVSNLYPILTIHDVIVDSVNHISLYDSLSNIKLINGYVQIGQKSGYSIGLKATAEGYNNIASGDYSHAEGSTTKAYGYASHAEGSMTTASGDFSHAEGYDTTASGYASHAEGNTTIASGDYSHAEGYYTTASGYASHAEGDHTTASGDYSHAEGYYTTASGDFSHAEGYYTVASENQTVFGQYNYNNPQNMFEIGNGSPSQRSNALEIMAGGSMKLGTRANKHFMIYYNGPTDTVYNKTTNAPNDIGISNSSLSNIPTPSGANIILNPYADKFLETYLPSGETMVICGISQYGGHEYIPNIMLGVGAGGKNRGIYNKMSANWVAMTNGNANTVDTSYLHCSCYRVPVGNPGNYGTNNSGDIWISTL